MQEKTLKFETKDHIQLMTLLGIRPTKTQQPNDPTCTKKLN